MPTTSANPPCAGVYHHDYSAVVKEALRPSFASQAGRVYLTYADRNSRCSRYLSWLDTTWGKLGLVEHIFTYPKLRSYGTTAEHN